MCVVGRVLSAQNKKCISLQYLQKNMGDEVEFLPQINTNIFYKLIVSFWVCRARHAQSTLNDKSPISLQYLKENVKGAVDFLSANKHERFLQIDTIILNVYYIKSLLFFLQYLKKEVNDEVDFLHGDKHNSFPQIDDMILMGMIRHSQST